MPRSAAAIEDTVARRPDGKPLSCREKIKLLNENLEEIRERARDALEDAILMGGDERQLRQVLHGIIDALEKPYPERAARENGPGEGKDGS